MPKAAISDVTDFGFRAEQFGSPADFMTATTGYVARVLNDVALVVEDHVGAIAYAAATGVQLFNIKSAEKFLAAAELWRRREAFRDSNTRIGGGDAGIETIGSRFLESASKMEELALDHLAKASSTTAVGGVSVGAVESGPYPAVGA